MAEVKETALFSDIYFFRGEHAQKARELTNIIDKTTGLKIFQSAIELYIVAAVVGLKNNRREKIVKSDAQQYRIDVGQFISHSRDVEYVYQLVMLTYPDDKLKPIDRINNAFRYSKEKCTQNTINMEIFEGYMLGGVSILYDQFINEDNQRYSEYLSSLKSLISEYSLSNSDSTDEEFDFDTPEEF